MFNWFNRRPKREGDVYKLYKDTVRIDLEPKFRKVWSVYVLNGDGRFHKVDESEVLDDAFEIAKQHKG